MIKVSLYGFANVILTLDMFELQILADLSNLIPSPTYVTTMYQFTSQQLSTAVMPELHVDQPTMPPLFFCVHLRQQGNIRVMRLGWHLI